MPIDKNLAGLELCRACFNLRGPFFDTFNRCKRVQTCACEPKQQLWNAFDYNTAAELCHCCASQIVSSGSKWSLFFCIACKALVVAHNQTTDGPTIPIGRHSIMNRVALRADRAREPGAGDALAGGLVGVFGGVQRLRQYEREHLATVAGSMPGAPNAIPVCQYLEYAEARVGRDQAFAELVRTMEGPPA